MDRTHARKTSFFGKGCVAHGAHGPSGRAAAMAAHRGCRGGEDPVVLGGTLVCIEGPQFSTYAESMTYKKLGYDVIGMTAMPEAKLAREAEITYATIAMVTDYDCRHPEHDNVDVACRRRRHQNAVKVARLVARVARDFPAEHEPCPAGSDRALDGAIDRALRPRSGASEEAGCGGGAVF